MVFFFLIGEKKVIFFSPNVLLRPADMQKI